jgi:hypothetical protein
MRAGIGLVGLLIGVGLLVYLFAEHSIPTARQGKAAQDEARQIAGYGEDGRSAMESITVSRQEKNGKLVGLNVDSVVPNGAMQNFFGLMPGDVITEIGSPAGMEKVKELIGGDDMAEPKLHEAFQQKRQLTVLRNGKQITLPGGAAVAGAAPSAPTVTPANPAPAPAPSPAPAPAPRKPGGLESQLDAIQRSGGAEPAKDQ